MKNFLLLIVMYLFYNQSCAVSNLIKKAVNVSSSYYTRNFATTVVWWQNESLFVNDFLKAYPNSVVLCPLDNYNHSEVTVGAVNEAVGFKQTIYFGTNLKQYGTFMKLINDIIRFPILFILVLEKQVSLPAVLSKYIKVTWRNDQGDLIIISADEDDEIKLSTFFPYGNEICRNFTPTPLHDETDLFPAKFSNFHRCPIRTALLQFKPYVEIEVDNGTITSVGGYDGIILTIILNKLNASLEVTSADNHNVYGSYVNGTATGSISDLASEKADILIPSGILTHKRYSVTLPSVIYHTADYRWIGPKQREVYDWLKILVLDRANVTPIHGLTFSAFVITVFIIRKCKPRETKSMNQVLFHTFAMLLGQTVKFVVKSTVLNCLFLLWIWCCYIVRIDYQGDLIQGLHRVKLEPPFKSVDDAITRVDSYGGSEVFLDYYRDTPLEKNYQVISLTDIPMYIQRIFEGERFLLAADLVLIREVQHDIQIINDQISMTGACYFMRPGWPAANEVDRIIISLVEAGLVEDLLTKHNSEWKIDRSKNKDNGPRRLNMSTLGTIFYGLAFMWLVCTIVLIIEIMYYNKHNERKEANF